MSNQKDSEVGIPSRPKPLAQALPEPKAASGEMRAGHEERIEAIEGVALTPYERRNTPTPNVPRPHAHAHEGPAAEGSHTHAPFPHAKLDAYRVALEMAASSKKVAADIPRGHRSIADHMLRAAANTVLLLAEGANRRSAPEKRQRFVESRGECAEVAAAADLLIALGLAEQAEAERLSSLASRVSAMLTRLIARLK